MIIVIPAAGQGSRFAHQRYTAPKPFIEINKRPMIHHVFDNFLNSWQADLRFVVITRDFPQTLYLESISSGYNLASVTTGFLTAGTAKSLLAAGHLVAGDEPVVVANCDQLITDHASLNQFLGNVANKQSSILTFKCSDASNKWSYVRKNNITNFVELVREKEPISEEACTGIFGFASGNAMLQAILKMIEAKQTVNNEYYLAPSYNFLIETGAPITTVSIAEKDMVGLGTPEDLEAYINC